MAGTEVIRVNAADKRDFDLYKAELAKKRGEMVTQEEAFRELLRGRDRQPSSAQPAKLSPPGFF